MSRFVGLWTKGEPDHVGPHPFEVKTGDCILPSRVVAACTSLQAAEAAVRLLALDGARVIPHPGRLS